jgi:hypothetical protein
MHRAHCCRVPAVHAGGFGLTVVAYHARRQVGTGRPLRCWSPGRTHPYEGHPATRPHGARTAAVAGAGDHPDQCIRRINESSHVGPARPAHDHLNLTGRSPMTGPSHPPACVLACRPDRPVLPRRARWPGRPTPTWAEAPALRCTGRTTRRLPRSGCPRHGADMSVCPRRWRRSPPSSRSRSRRLAGHERRRSLVTLASTTQR